MKSNTATSTRLTIDVRITGRSVGRHRLVLVLVRPDRHLAGVRRGLEHADAGPAGRLEHDVGTGLRRARPRPSWPVAASVKSQCCGSSETYAASTVISGFDRSRPGLIAGEEPGDHRRRAGADEADLMPVDDFDAATTPTR